MPGTPASRFEKLALQALRAGLKPVVDGPQKVARLANDLPDGDRYVRAYELLRNVGRGLKLQKGRGDAYRVYAVTMESVAPLQGEFRDLLSGPVVELLMRLMSVAQKEAEATRPAKPARSG